MSMTYYSDPILFLSILMMNAVRFANAMKQTRNAREKRQDDSLVNVAATAAQHNAEFSVKIRVACMI